MTGSTLVQKRWNYCNVLRDLGQFSLSIESTVTRRTLAASWNSFSALPKISRACLFRFEIAGVQPRIDLLRSFDQRQHCVSLAGIG